MTHSVLSPLRAHRPEEDGVDSIEVPAAVVCARCGKPDCLGCEPLDDTTLPSGVVAIVPWERPGASAWTRLWSTAGLVTRSSPQFFRALPKGEAAPATMFAVVSELAAIGSSAVVLMMLVAALAPSFVSTLLSTAPGQAIAARLLLVGVPGFAAIMILAHVTLGLAMNHASVRLGGKNRKSQAMRFGLYSTGWDLMTSPFGLLVSLFAEGPRSVVSLLPLSVGVASHAALAFARGVLQLDEAGALQARRFGTRVAMAFTFASVALLLLILAILIVV